jgi:hypothetical protein
LSNIRIGAGNSTLINSTGTTISGARNVIVISYFLPEGWLMNLLYIVTHVEI